MSASPVVKVTNSCTEFMNDSAVTLCRPLDGTLKVLRTIQKRSTRSSFVRTRYTTWLRAEMRATPFYVERRKRMEKIYLIRRIVCWILVSIVACMPVLTVDVYQKGESVSPERMDQPKHKKAIERKTWHQIPFLLSFACCCWARGRVIRSEGNHKAPERRKTVAKRKRRVEKMKLIISISSRHGIRIHKWFRFDCFDPTA